MLSRSGLCAARLRDAISALTEALKFFPQLSLWRIPSNMRFGSIAPRWLITSRSAPVFTHYSYRLPGIIGSSMDEASQTMESNISLSAGTDQAVFPHLDRIPSRVGALASVTAGDKLCNPPLDNNHVHSLCGRFTQSTAPKRRCSCVIKSARARS